MFSVAAICCEQVTRDVMPCGQTVSSRLRTLGALRFARHQVELGRHLAELGKRTSIHLSHRLAAVDLHCSLGNTDITGDLLAEAPLRDVNHDFSLPGA